MFTSAVFTFNSNIWISITFISFKMLHSVALCLLLFRIYEINTMFEFSKISFNIPMTMTIESHSYTLLHCEVIKNPSQTFRFISFY